MSNDELRAKAAKEVDRWEQAIADELMRVFDRQEAVVLARLQGTKARKHTRHWTPAGTRPLEVKAIIDPARWIKDAAGSLTPLISRLFAAVHGRVSKQLAEDSESDDAADPVPAAVTARINLIAQGIETQIGEVEDFVAKEEAAGTPMAEIAAGVHDLYEQRKATWAARIATVSAVGSINQAALLAATKAGSSAKQWLSRRDPKVRDTHEAADGQVRLLDEMFRLGGIPSHPKKSLLLFPGDPSPNVPLDEIMNCRCTMLFSPPRASKSDPDLLEVKDRVRTPAGAQQYGQPIGSVIHRDLIPAFTHSPGAPAQTAGTPVPSPAGNLGRPNKVIGRLGSGAVVEVASDDPDVRRLIARHAAGGVVPDQASTSVVVLRDRHGKVGAYVVWASADGGGAPKGTIVEVSVAPGLRGHHVGDQLVALAAKEDPNISVTTRPAPAGPLPGVTRSVPVGPPMVRDRRAVGDVAGTSGDFKADSARIDRLQKAYLRDRMDTESLFQKHGRWTRAREKQQQDIIDHFLAAPGVKADHKILVLGGLPGAGKTSTINSPAGQQALGIDLADYVTVNADEVKAEMVKAGMVPDYPGLTPDEAATLYHAESFEIAHSLMRQAAKRNLNFSYDTSLKSTGQLGFATSAGSRTMPPPWETTLLFVDVPTSVAKQRARDRYLAGGRYMPLGLIDRMGTGPRRNFDLSKRGVDRYVLVDNAGAAPVVADQGGRRPGRAARLARAQAAVGGSGATAAPAVAAARVAAPATSVATVPSAAVTAGPPAPAAPSSLAATSVLPPALPPVPAGARVYTHPQGKTIFLLPDGSMQVFKPDGKRATSSATPQKLAAGYGGWVELPNDHGSPAPQLAATPTASAAAPALVPRPAVAPVEEPSTPAPVGAMHVVPMDFNEAPLSDVPKYVADPNYVFQQKVDGIRGVLVIEAGKPPWFASKKGDRLQSSTAAAITAPILAKLPATPAGSPSYRVEGELLNGKWHVFDMVVAGQESTPYDQRQKMAAAWVDAVSPQLSQVQALPTAETPAAKQALWDQVLKSGAEGVMMKRRDSPYNAGARVSHTLKAKVTATADVVVMARNIGGKDNAEFGMIRNGRLESIGTVSTGGKDKALGQINVGDVVEVEYLWASADQKLTQPRIIRKRPDKTANDATDVSQLRFVDKAVLALAAKALQVRLEYALEAS